jgi:hypothetical protein
MRPVEGDRLVSVDRIEADEDEATEESVAEPQPDVDNPGS